MTSCRFFSLLLMGLVAVATATEAQDHQHPAGDEQQLGQIVFPTSCATDVQDDFNRAVAMLHSFWYQAAEKAFAALAQEDPSCAMAHWGIAMSRFHPLWEPPGPEDVRVGQAALERARGAGGGTERERAYIDALQRFYADAESTDHLDRMVQYQQEMGRLSRQYADDSEAAILYALAVLGTASASPPDKTYARQLTAGAILYRIFEQQPRHPGVAHYIIHSHDYPELASRALDAARRYAEIAPGAPHALHMPSHIFTRLGLWQESISSNRAAAAAAHKDQWTGEELHTKDYLTYAFLQGAQDSEAKRILDELPALRVQLRKDDSNYYSGLYAIAAIPARHAVERRRWEDAAALAVPAGVFPGGGACWTEAALHFARGLGAGHTEQPALARRSIEFLEDCREKLLEEKNQLWANLVEVQRRAVHSALMLSEGNRDAAFAMMRSAARLEDSTDKPPTTPGAIVPARELLGEMLLAVDRPADGLLEFEATLRDAPNRYRALHGAARAAEQTGDTRKASAYYKTLVKAVDRRR